MTSRKRPGSFKAIVRAINQYTQGWIHYHGIGQMKHFIQETAGWFNRRLRQLCWSRWKRVKTRYQMLRKYGLPHEIAIQYANSRKGYWRLSKPYQMSLALPTKRLIAWGLKDINPQAMSSFIRNIQLLNCRIREPYVRWWERSTSQLMASLLLD
ncbi:group II intron maturase-specific domain-containing protein [Suicoccus acidiformans]|uniref:group II intron maturase-specific domain-containing protein n=1 Tax=Suicoccus acidiformans TaxID=2036206 RepID=UPI001F099EA4|nr:group II intron maturase-specific domain-containing protein [Suicoccus acidiformans]